MFTRLRRWLRLTQTAHSSERYQRFMRHTNRAIYWAEKGQAFLDQGDHDTARWCLLMARRHHDKTLT